jgi:hypothetical protein
LHKLEETSLKEERLRRKTKLPGENCKDKALTNVLNKFKINVYFYTLNKIVGTLNSRFQSSRGILTDLNLLYHMLVLKMPQKTHFFLQIHF